MGGNCPGRGTDLIPLMTARSRGIHWFCKDCDAQAMKDVQTGQHIEERCMHYFEKCRAEIHEVEVALSTRIDTEVARLDSEVGVLKKSSASQKSKIAKLSKNLDKVMGKMEEYEVAVEQKIDEKTSNIAQMSISEVLEREKRKDQLILFNIKESDKAEAKDRKAEDTNEVNRILESINAPSEYAMINRVGPKGATPWPVKIKLKNQDDQTKILKAAKNLKGTEIYINKDMTPIEQAEHRILVMELKRRGETRSNEQSQQSDQCNKSGARGGSGLQRDIPRPKPGRSSSVCITNAWNSLPEDVISAPTLNTFKNRLDEAWIKYKYCTDLDWLKKN